MKKGPGLKSNAQLKVYKYKASTALANKHSVADKLLRLVLGLVLQLLVTSLKTLSVPVGRLLSLYIWAGKTALSLTLFVEKLLLRIVGVLSQTLPRESRLGRLTHHYFGVDCKRWHLGVVALVLGGVVHGMVHTVRASFDERLKRARWLRRLMAASTTYDEWRSHAAKLEQLTCEDVRPGRGVAKHEDYDRKLLQEKLRHLRRTRATGNPREQMLALRIDLIRNVANIAKSQAHRQNFVSVPQPIQQYIKEVQEQLEQLVSWPEAELPLDEKVSFFRVTRHAYGRTALLLSGGGGLGTFHLGVCKALFERKLLPRVLAGSSVGSIVCAVVGTRTDEELKRTFANLEKFDIGFFQNSTALDLVRYAMNKGHLQDISYMICKLRQLLGDCTFLEAFERTGRILNVTVCPADTNEPPRLLNYMTAPQALVWSAVAASSSFPGLYPPQHLLGRNSNGENIKLHGHGGSDALQRRWRDGSLEFDLPVQTLAEMFNCNHFLVSQTNPHIVPLLNFKSIFPRKWASIMEAELKHRLQVVQWMLPEWKLSKWLTLFTQPWEGDITFTLPSMLWNLRKTIVNPSTLELMRATQVGEHATWERMAAIECNCTIEATLDRCAAKLQHRARGHSLATIGGKVPSWLHMPSPGLSNLPAQTASWGDGIADNDPGAAVASWGDFHAAIDNSSSRVHLPPLHRPPLYYSVHGDYYGTATDAGSGQLGDSPQHATGRLPPIPSSRSSDHDDHEDGFDSASSVAAAAGMLSGTMLPRVASLRRAEHCSGPSGSAGISRRSSMMRNLHLLAGGAEGEAGEGHAHPHGPGAAQYTGQYASKSSPLCANSANGAVPDSTRSSISLPEQGLPPASGAPRPPAPTTQPAAGDGSPGAEARASLPPLHPPRRLASTPAMAPATGAAAGSASPAYGAEGVRRPRSSPAGSPLHRGARPVSASSITEEQLLALASMDTGGMIDDLWGTLLPLAGTCESLTAHQQQHRAHSHGHGAPSMASMPKESDGDGIDIFAY